MTKKEFNKLTESQKIKRLFLSFNLALQDFETSKENLYEVAAQFMGSEFTAKDFDLIKNLTLDEISKLIK